MASCSSERSARQSNAHLFATTHWSVVLAAGQSPSPETADPLEALCRTYWYAIYAYVRRRGYDLHDAQDLTQQFFADHLARNFLSHVDRSKGKFRSFLLATLSHFLSNQRHRAQAEKRGGGRPVISWDDEHAETRFLHEPATGLTPEKSFEKRWALTLVSGGVKVVENRRFEIPFSSGSPGRGARCEPNAAAG